MTETKKPRRRQKLIKPRLQLKVGGIFLGVAIMAILVQFGLYLEEMTRVAERHPGAVASAFWPMWRNLAITAGILVPMMVAASVLATHRVLGPIYRYERYLSQLAAGEDPGDLKTRDGDELEDLRVIIQKVTDHVRELRSNRPSGSPQTETTEESTLA